MTADSKLNRVESRHETIVSKKVEALPTQQSTKWFANEAEEPLALFEEVEASISTGDIALHSGNKPFAIFIRGFTYSRFSHVGLFYRDEEGELWIVDVCEGRGGAKILAKDVIAKHPGRWYWAHVSRRRFPDFDSEKLAAGIDEMIQWKYGYWGIVFQLGIHAPVIRELAYMLHADKIPYFSNRPFCSAAVTRKIRKCIPSCDPVPDRVPHLVTPQDLAQSLLWHPKKVALYP